MWRNCVPGPSDVPPGPTPAESRPSPSECINTPGESISPFALPLPPCAVSSKEHILLFCAIPSFSRIFEHQLYVQVCKDIKEVKVTEEFSICFRIQDAPGEKLQNNPRKFRFFV